MYNWMNRSKLNECMENWVKYRYSLGWESMIKWNTAVSYISATVNKMHFFVGWMYDWAHTINPNESVWGMYDWVSDNSAWNY